MEINMSLKQCPKCKKQVPESGYSRSQYRVNAYCKPCMAQYNRQRNEIRKKRKKGGWTF